ncbi:MAG: NAD(P)/FAD-dependent oxidoreductase [Clostridia bacterium]|nr:NAD(P)/FAD-dependent oxidoreductase [Clostridia bacterium]
MYHVIVIGAGAAGMIAAGTAAKRGLKVTVLDKNSRPGKKLRITGKGRCNVTNNCTELSDLISNVPVNGRFLYSAFSSFMPSDTMRFFEESGVPLKTERGRRVFPVSDSAHDIAEALARFTLKSGADIKNETVTDITHENDRFRIETENGKCYSADKVIIATGGASYPLTGSTGDGYEFARRLGHSVTDLKPSLVPLVAHEGFCSDLMGLSLRNVSVKVIDKEKNKEIFSDFGEMLFTHFGVSGPLILSASSHMRDMKRGKYAVSIDLKPALTIEQLDNRILRDFSESLNKNFINSLNSLLPKKLVPVIVRLSHIPPATKTNQITKEQRRSLAELLKDFRITVKGFRPIDEAIITSGGVSVSEINPKTMESKLINGLFFAGEVIDVDAYTGGYNLQIAFSTGCLAGSNV